ncbi:NUDIX domain-containing protein [Candidatus Woesearchaeota archaeon]|nr:NUDIX domain-containing protein [Candidatus Woesearchaeota archaeon]
MKCILHGSLRKNFDLLQEVHALFTSSYIEVIAPKILSPVGETDGFVHLTSDESKDPRVVELLYLQKRAELGTTGFSYYVNPQGVLGKSASYELAIDQLTNTRTLFMQPLQDLPAYIPQNSFWKPKELVQYVLENQSYPPPFIPQDEESVHSLLQKLILPGSIIAVGGIIIDYSQKRYKVGQERETLLVKTHKWGGRFSIIGGKVKRNERLNDALLREVKEETGLEIKIEESICTFDQIKNSGYYLGDTHQVFTDNVVVAQRREIALNEEAEEYRWVPPTVALQELPLEPNARKTVELYIERHLRIA